MKLKILGLATLVAIMPLAPAVATTTAGTGTGSAMSADQRGDEEDEFPWGLLGLLGLAGLLGRKRENDHVTRNTTAR